MGDFIDSYVCIYKYFALYGLSSKFARLEVKSQLTFTTITQPILNES